MKTAMQQLHEHLINSWSSPGDLWRPDKIIEKVESMIEMEKKNTMENLTKDQAATRKAIKDCAEWLKFCLSIGWQKEQLGGLQKIWWEHHDEKGNLTASGSVAASRNKLLSLGDKHFIIDEIASLRQQLKEREEALKELLPIAENAAYFAGFLPQFTESELEQYENESKPIIEKARKLISK